MAEGHTAEGELELLERFGEAIVENGISVETIEIALSRMTTDQQVEVIQTLLSTLELCTKLSQAVDAVQPPFSTTIGRIIANVAANNPQAFGNSCQFDGNRASILIELPVQVRIILSQARDIIDVRTKAKANKSVPSRGVPLMPTKQFLAQISRPYLHSLQTSVKSCGYRALAYFYRDNVPQGDFFPFIQFTGEAELENQIEKSEFRPGLSIFCVIDAITSNNEKTLVEDIGIAKVTSDFEKLFGPKRKEYGERVVLELSTAPKSPQTQSRAVKVSKPLESQRKLDNTLPSASSGSVVVHTHNTRKRNREQEARQQPESNKKLSGMQPLSPSSLPTRAVPRQHSPLPKSLDAEPRDKTSKDAGRQENRNPDLHELLLSG